MRTFYRIFIFIWIIATLFLFSYAYQKSFSSYPIEGEYANVTKVVDGDTIEVDLKGVRERVRLLDINTPEKKQPYYLDAVSFLKQKITDKEVKLVAGVENRDKYHRLV